MLRMMVAGEYSYRNLTILTGREPVSSDQSRAIFRRWPNATVNGIYGLTETGTCDFFRCDQNNLPLDNSLGHPAKEIEFITDPVTSELLIRSPSAMLDYLDMPELTNKTLRDGWIKTGDIGKLNDEGEVALCGRIKDLINRGVNKISPIEVEAVFTNHPEVSASIFLSHLTKTGNRTLENYEYFLAIPTAVEGNLNA